MSSGRRWSCRLRRSPGHVRRHVSQAIRISPSSTAPRTSDRLDRRQPRGAAGRHVEARAVPRALDRAILDLARGQREVAVRAVVAERVDLTIRVRQAHLDVADLDAAAACSAGRRPAARDADEAAGRGPACSCRDRSAIARAAPRPRPASAAGPAPRRRSRTPRAAPPSARRDAAAHDVEQLLLVELTDRRRVRAAHVVRLDLEVRQRVASAFARQDQVAVRLIRVRALRLREHLDQAAEHCARCPSARPCTAGRWWRAAPCGPAACCGRSAGRRGRSTGRACRCASRALERSGRSTARHVPPRFTTSVSRFASRPAIVRCVDRWCTFAPYRWSATYCTSAALPAITSTAPHENVGVSKSGESSSSTKPTWLPSSATISVRGK
jgi:hypothetical protein